jgi:kinesin family protein C1
VFAYGQTGSGKTWTMSGGAWKQNGIIQQAIRYVRSQACALQFDKFKISCTLVQLYKSHLVDLFRRDD